MKKSLLSIMGVAVTALAFGQSYTPLTKKASHKVTQELSVAGAPTMNRAGSNGTAALGAVLFEETFGNGLAGDGTNGAWTTHGTTSGTPNPGAIWEYRGTATNPDNTVGSRGTYAGSGNPIVSPTVANGFFIFDSDYLDNSAGVSAPHKGWLESPTFSTVGSPSISINFNTYFRRYVGTAYVLLSNDGGTTWGDSVTIMDADWTVNAASDIDAVINQDISYIANSANAKVAFFFDGETEVGSSGPGYYFVQVDDLVISESPDNNLAYEGTYMNSVADSNITSYYTNMPVSQAMMDTVTFASMYSNRGAVTQPNTRARNNWGSPSGTGLMESTPADLMPNTSDSVAINGYQEFSAGVGAYYWALDVKSDSTDDVPTNTFADTMRLNVTDTTYGRDYQAVGNSFYSGSGYELGASLVIFDSVKATSVTTFVGSASTAGEIISVYLYDGNLDVPISKREFHTLSQSDIDNGVTLSIPEVILEPGRYIVTYRTYADEVYFRRSAYDADPQTCYIQIDADGTWYWTSTIPAVRLNISEDLFVCDVAVAPFQTANNTADAGVTGGTQPYSFLWSDGQTTEVATGLPSGLSYTVVATDDNGCVSNSGEVMIIDNVNEVELNNAVSVYPNPNNGNFTLQLEGLSGSYTVSVMNAVGQTISVETVNVSGSLNKAFNTGLSKGMYLIQVEDAAGSKVIKQFIIE